MGKGVLITGGAGFLGSYVADELLRCGYKVRALDNLWPQVHGDGATRPDYLNKEVELIVGDVRDPSAVKTACDGVSIVVHFAACVGVAQSMYRIRSYSDTNVMGTAVLLEALCAKNIEKLVVASSMSIYGEGLYVGPDGAVHENVSRQAHALLDGQFEVLDETGAILEPLPTPETKPPSLQSIYASNKHAQEVMCLAFGRGYGIPACALRFWNAYGPRQALSNPYTGALAIFASRLLNDKPPLVFEDGRQMRDFVSAHDVARAVRLAIESPHCGQEVFNVASGRPVSVVEVARRIAAEMGKDHIAPEITGKCRAGDIRNCIADISKARRVLGYEPRVSLEEGVKELAAWLAGRSSVDRLMHAREELAVRGLTT
ncbi:MAG: NAD-dependent epimerase/dehydratase family protein [Planctomycetes bacterium]|nr:NAD-dependent epimerase/dehydratase family protein [Planctomycetota bacterium]